MFKRKITQELLNWKNNYSGKYAVLLQGARRVGKSTVVEEFAKENYKSYILVDFSNISKEMSDVFDNISSLDLFFLMLQNITSTKLYERESVIIFDEIQLAPKVRQAIKHLVKDGRYDYIETGSLISIKKNIEKIVIPSEEMKINMYPMDYEEFCWATNRDYSVLKDLYMFNKKIGDSVNRKLMRDFRLYMAVGGMPQAVEAFVEKKTFQEIDSVKKEIIELYKDDFKKIDSSGRISAIYESIPSQLALSKNRFKLSSALNKRIKSSDEEMLYNLLDSKTVIPCYNVADPSVSLNATKDISTFKLYLSDIGLFTTMIFNDKSIISENIYSKLIGDKLDSNLGYLYENAIAQIIKSHNRELYYHFWRENNKTHPYEVDFIISDGAKIIPVEVKSSNINNHKSIREFSKKYSKSVSRRILFSQHDVSNDEMLELKPIYLAQPFFDSLEQ
ncbi:MAG: AAA family ATPase [Clostridiales bacterium]|nr:AAA family ATPase [Clostridiales bacterium]